MASINTNASANQARQALAAVQRDLATTQARVATGKKIASAKDNGSTWSIAKRMGSDGNSWTAVRDSLNRGQSILDVAANGASDAEGLLEKLKEKALAYSDTSISDDSRKSIQSDMESLIGLLDRSINSANFDGINILNSSGPSGGVQVSSSSAATLSIHYAGTIGVMGVWAPLGSSVTGAYHVADANGAITNVSVPAMYPAPAGDQHADWTLATPLPAGTTYFTFNPPTGYHGFDVVGTGAKPVDVLSDTSGNTISLGAWDLRSTALGINPLDWSDPKGIVGAIQNAHQTVTNVATRIGTQQNAVEANLTTAQVQQDSLSTGVGNLVDADMAKESAKLQADQVKESLATKALAIANAAPQWIASLFK